MDDLIADLVDLINNFDPASYMPKIDSIVGWIEIITRICVMAAPVIMLVFGLTYWFLPAKEANHEAGYRCYFGMGSVEAWHYTQKLAGQVFLVAGGVMAVVAIVGCIILAGKETADAVMPSMVILIIQLVVALGAFGFVEVMVARRFDTNGQIRESK